MSKYRLALTENWADDSLNICGTAWNPNAPDSQVYTWAVSIDTLPGETPDGGEDWDNQQLNDRSQTWDSWQDSGLDLYKSGEENPLDLEEREDLDELAREIYEYALEKASKIYDVKR